MSSLVKRTNISYDIDQLNFERKKMDVPWFNKTQTGLQYAKKEWDLHTQSCGSFTHRILVRGLVDSEDKFDKIVPDYEHTLFAKVIKETNAFRTRILIRPKQTTYSVHKDVTHIRYHLALDTNDHAYVIYPEHGQIHNIPADGYVYSMITSVVHTVANCGMDRTHLVWGSHDTL